MKEYFEKSDINTTEVRSILEQFKKSYEDLSVNFSYRGFPNSRKLGNSGETLFMIQSVFAKDITDLESRTEGYLSLSQHRKLMDALKALLPYYEKSIWNPSLKKIKNKKSTLEQLSKKAEINNLFDLASTFYGANWPTDKKFVIALYPIPGERGHATAESLESVESVGILTDEKTDAESFGVLFHELCHSLYNTQDASFQEQFEKWFDIEKSTFGNLTQYRINEVLATALGNGFAFERASGKPDEGSWYNNKYINGLAKGIYPLLKEYLSQRKQIDKNFIEKTIAEFQKRFPDAPYDYSNLMNKVVMLVDADQLNRTDIKNTLNKLFKVNSRSIYDSLEDENGISELQSSPNTAIVIVANKNRDKLSGIAKNFEKAEKVFQEAIDSTEDGLWWTQLSPGRSLLILKADSTKGVLEIFTQMQEPAQVDPSRHRQMLKL
ncbi:MAG: hypothetical protein KA715_08770 [Xanthomonadaceae bacterium]|nr:hypothetical protein [Xanthomonadaceae bacterium]